MPKRNFKTKGSFIPKGESGKRNRIVVDNPALAEFLKQLEGGKSAVLAEEIIATETVGGVVANETVFEVGTPLEDIIRLMLEGQPEALPASISMGTFLDGTQTEFDYASLRMPGEEATVGGVRFTFEDPQGEVTEIVWQAQENAAEIFTEQADTSPFVQGGTTNEIDTADVTVGGLNSDVPYTTYVDGIGSNFSNLQSGWIIKMKNVEGNQVGNTVNRAMNWAPPAFMINMPEGTGANALEAAYWITSATQLWAAGFAFPGTDTTVVLNAAIAEYLQPQYYPIIRHTKTGNYGGTNTDVITGESVSWYQPDTITDTEQVGLGDTNTTTTFFDAAVPYRQLWFIPSGGQANTSFGNTVSQGGGALDINSFTGLMYFDIGQGGLGLSSAGDVINIEYNMYWLNQTNALQPITAPITFNL
jgi:hypothetical protein